MGVNRRVRTQLTRELGVAGLKQADERTLLERSTDGLHFGELAAPAKDVEKLRALSRRAPERPRLMKDDAPGYDREDGQDEKNDLGNGAGAGEQAEHNGARAFGYRSPLRLLQQQGEPRVSKRAQTTLRDRAVRRWDSAIGKSVSRRKMAVKP